MRYKEIEFSNCGPVLNGTIKRKKITAFFGQNNSGKSMVSRLIHGINLMNTAKSRLPQSLRQSAINDENDDTVSQYYNAMVLKNSGMDSRDIITYKRRNARINIKKDAEQLTLNFKIGRKHDTQNNLLVQRYADKTSKISRHSVYIPAARTGIIQFLTDIAQIKDRLQGDVLQTPAVRDTVNHKWISTRGTEQFARLPGHLKQFYDLVFAAHADVSSRDVQRLFSKLFQGLIQIKNVDGLSEISYKEDTGFITNIESAGAGIVSSFPIISGMYYVKKGGMLIIEQPEMHMGPPKQSRLIESLQSVAYERKIDLILNTCSDYIVKELLDLVSNRKIKPSDLGLYYFERETSDFTVITEIRVGEDGYAEHPVFEDALCTFVAEFMS